MEEGAARASAEDSGADGALAALIAAVEARTSPYYVYEPLAEGAPDHVGAALRAYYVVHDRHPDADLTARALLAQLVPRVLADGAEARRAMRADPAEPGLEATYRALIVELGALAAPFASMDCETRASPDPRDPFADEYRQVSAETKDLMAACATARPTWRIMKLSRASARRAPPPRRRPRAPLADDAEYYIP